MTKLDKNLLDLMRQFGLKLCGKPMLFSHEFPDLEKDNDLCHDQIQYIKSGKLVEFGCEDLPECQQKDIDIDDE